MRGGTSKAVFLKESDLPARAGSRRRRPSSRSSGRPTSARSTASAAPIRSPASSRSSARRVRTESRAAGTHLTYTFGQVEIDGPEVDYLSLCGNISSAVGAFAVYEESGGADRAGDHRPRLQHQPRPRPHAGSSGAGGRPVERGDYSVPGVPGTGAKILVDLSDTAGAATGALLPTGRPVVCLDVPGVGTIEASLVDIGNAHVFVRARDVGLAGTETAAEIDADAELRHRLERIRGAAAWKMGMISDPARSRVESPATPILGIVSPPADYVNDLTQATVRAADVDRRLASHVHAADAQDLRRHQHRVHRRGESYSRDCCP